MPAPFFFSFSGRPGFVADNSVAGGGEITAAFSLGLAQAFIFCFAFDPPTAGAWYHWACFEGTMGTPFSQA